MSLANGLQMSASSRFKIRRTLRSDSLMLWSLFSSILIGAYAADSLAESVEFKNARLLVFSGQVLEGIERLEVMASEDNTDALLELSRIYSQGHYADRDYDLAREYGLRAKALGSREASYFLAEWLDYWITGKKDESTIRSLQTQGFEGAWCSGFAPEGATVETRTERCVGYEESRSGSGNIRSQLMLADWHPDPARRAGWLAIAESQGSYYAKLTRLRAEWRSDPKAESLREALQLFKNPELYFGKEGGLVGLNPLYWLPGYRTEDGRIASVESIQSKLIDDEMTPEEINNFKSGSNKWLAETTTVAKAIVAAFARTGWGNRLASGKDEELAYRLYAECAQDEDSDYLAFCLNWQGIMLGAGLGVPKDSNKSFQLVLRAANLDEVWALGNVCEAYVEGDGVEVNYQSAVEFCTRAIGANNFGAGYQLGTLYERGWGVRRDFEKAQEFYTLAAENPTDGIPHTNAMLALAGLLERDPQNRSQVQAALRWYSNALDAVEGTVPYTVSSDAGSYAAQAKAGIHRTGKRLEELEQNLWSDVRFGEYRALIVANQKYTYLPDLNSPAKDGQDVGEILSSKFGFAVEYLFDSSRNEFLAKVNEYKNELGPQDNFLIFYAGHGVFDTDLNLGFWQLADAESEAAFTWVDTDRLTQTLNLFRTRNIMVIADSCFSAAMLRGAGEFELGSPDDLGAMQALIDRKTRVALTSGGMEPVIDSSGGHNSIFAEELLRALAASEDIATAAQIFDRVRGRVASRSRLSGYEQIPEFSPLFGAGHDGGDFIFRRVVTAH